MPLRAWAPSAGAQPSTLPQHALKWEVRPSACPLSRPAAAQGHNTSHACCTTGGLAQGNDDVKTTAVVPRKRKVGSDTCKLHALQHAGS